MSDCLLHATDEDSKSFSVDLEPSSANILLNIYKISENMTKSSCLGQRRKGLVSIITL